MSENEEERPLTRREIRLREMAAAERDHESPAREDVTSPQEDVSSPDDDIVISPVNEDGTLRSRRELRELRAQALAEREAQRSTGAEDVAESETPEPDASPETEAPSEPDEAPQPEAASETHLTGEPETGPETDAAVEPDAHAEGIDESESEASAAPEDDAESEAESEAVAEAEAESTVVDEEPDDDAADESADARDDELGVDESPTDASDETDAPTQPFTVQDLREAEQRGEGAASDGDEDNETSEDTTAEERAADDVADATSDAPTVAMALDPLPADVEETDDRPLDVAEEAAAVDEIISDDDQSQTDEADADAEAQSEQEDTGYSFPNIEPPEEWRSVFDDPSTRVVPSTPQTESTPTGEGFDDLISRAVVQEGSTGGSGASALILPSMPDDSGLTGSLGGTGELFVTGSIDVPKSIGETGGHASLHDSIEVDPMDDLNESPADLDPRDSGPVSARRAVSAMAQTGVPAASDVKQDQSTLPRILLFTGGGLIVVIGGLVIWGATNGFFG